MTHPQRQEADAPTEPARGAVAVAFVALTLIWGTTWAAIRIGLTGLPPLTGVALRFAIASLLLLVLIPALRARFVGGRRETALWLVSAVFSYAIPYVVIYWAEQWVPSGLAAVLFATYPLFVTLLAHGLLPGETLNVRSAVGVLGGFVGVALIFSEDFSRLGGERVALAAVVALASPLAAAIGSVAVKRHGHGLHPLSLTAVPMGLTAVIVGPLAWAFESDRTIKFDAVSVGALLYLSVVGTAVTFVIYFWLLSRIRASRVALVAYTTPLVAVLAGVLLFDEPVTARTALGGAMVIAGVGIALRSARHQVADERCRGYASDVSTGASET